MKTVKEIAETYEVSLPTVRYWIGKGLPYKKEKVMGRKLRTIIDPKDVDKFLGLGVRE